MNVAGLPIALDRETLAEFCRARGIRKLSLFGSVLRDDFDPGRSDVDVLVEYEPNVRPSWDIFEHARDFGRLVGHSVDMNTPGMLSRHFADAVMRVALPIYHAVRPDIVWNTAVEHLAPLEAQIASILHADFDEEP
ncbi:MAG: nucleotidyltransferase domain-containing protein [Opitutaceae bacterium]|nr:nucleotidyltransferase domain-containing protein [Opitutaceae bacterium]